MRGDASSLGAWMERRGYSPKTIRMYAAWHRRFGDWLRETGRPPITKCRPDDVRAFVDDCVKFSYSSRHSFRDALQKIWEWLGRKDCPTWMVRTPREPRPVSRALPDDGSIDRLLAEAERTSDMHYAAVVLMYYQGLRRETVASLPWWAFEREGWITVVTKNDQTHSVPLHEKTVGAIARLQRMGHWVFPGRRRGTHLAPATLNLWVRILGAGAGLGHVTPHRLRHTCGADGYDRTGDLGAVRDFLGHSRTSTTERYTRKTEASLRKVLAAL